MLPLHILTYNTLLNFGCHIGHNFLNNHIFTTWAIYVYLKPFNIALINLFKSIILARTGFLTLASVCEDKAPIWFVDLDPINKYYEKYAAAFCGEFSWQGRWSAGIISNYITFSFLINKLLRNERIWQNTRQKWFIGDINYWIKSRLSWPRYLFTQSVHTTQFPVREAFFLGIPCFGVVDTNAYSNTVSIAFPGNDDSSQCISFYNELIVNYILKKKFLIILMWYHHVMKDKTNMDEWYEQFNDYSNHINSFKYYAHENFEFTNSVEYSYKRVYMNNNFIIDNKFDYIKFLNTYGSKFRMLIKNSNEFLKTYIYRNESNLIYSMNKYFHKYFWINDLYNKAAIEDSYNVKFPYKPKRKFEE